MKIIKWILGIIVAVVAIVLLVALFVKKEYTVEREVTINKPKQEVFDYVKMIRNQENYSVWIRKDPNAIKEYIGTDGTVGFISKWDSKNNQVGKGEQEVKKITEGERIDYQIRFIKPFEGIAEVYMTTENAGTNQAKVKWVFNGTSKYPMNVMNLFIDGMLGKDMQASLNDLKTVLEK